MGRAARLTLSRYRADHKPVESLCHLPARQRSRACLKKIDELDGSFTDVARAAPEIVTYAIAIKDSYNLPLDLPTFSEVNLRDFAERLHHMKVKPTIARIRVIQSA